MTDVTPGKALDEALASLVTVGAGVVKIDEKVSALQADVADVREKMTTSDATLSRIEGLVLQLIDGFSANTTGIVTALNENNKITAVALKALGQPVIYVEHEALPLAKLKA